MRVFLSYPREEHDLVESVAVALRQVGHTVFFDLHQDAGRSFRAEILEEIRRCDVFISFLTRAGLADTRFFRTELNAAVKEHARRRLHLLPVRLESGLALPGSLNNFTAIEPSGDIPAEILLVVRDLRRPGYARRRVALAVAGTFLLAAVPIGSVLVRQDRQHPINIDRPVDHAPVKDSVNSTTGADPASAKDPRGHKRSVELNPTDKRPPARSTSSARASDKQTKPVAPPPARVLSPPPSSLPSPEDGSRSYARELLAQVAQAMRENPAIHWRKAQLDLKTVERLGPLSEDQQKELTRLKELVEGERLKQ